MRHKTSLYAAYQPGRPALLMWAHPAGSISTGAVAFHAKSFFKSLTLRPLPAPMGQGAILTRRLNGGLPAPLR